MKCISTFSVYLTWEWFANYEPFCKPYDFYISGGARMKHRTIWIVMLLSLVASTMPAFAELTCSKCGKKYDDRSRYSFCTADGAPLKGDNNQAVAGSMEIKTP